NRGRHGSAPPRDLEQTVESAEPKMSVRRRDLRDVVRTLDELSDELHELPNGDLVARIVRTSIKLLRDETNRGDVKLIDNAFAELRYALKVFAPYRDTRKISIFGSARTPEADADYKAAEAFGRDMEQNGWMVITGAGGGIMAAGHGGAGAEGSFGLNISLPFEQSANEFIHGDPKLVDFKYFFTRKLMFVRSSHAVALFPGGFGTMDEGFEVLTLIQTGKSPPMPLVMVDHDGSDYWSAWHDYVKDHLLRDGLISEQDLSLYTLTQDIREAAEHCRKFYENFHSLRYSRDLIILRLKHKVTDQQLGDVKERFGDIADPEIAERIGERAWRSCGPLKVERNEKKLRHLHRLVFPFNRKDHGRLRQMIDHLNDLPQP
ncbi:MAG: TIGR00730 family Rossman fold protein, partial [Planctomycetota bacterium]